MLGQFFLRYLRSSQSPLLLLPQLLPQLLSAATKTPPDVCFRSSLLALSSVILAASAASLHPSLASSICALSQKRYRTFLCIFSCVFLCAPSRPIDQGASSVFPFWLLPPFRCFLHPTAFFDLSFLLHPCHCLTDAQRILPHHQKESHFPNFPKVCLALGRLSLHLFPSPCCLSSVSS